jgi:hypothetical protein
MLIVETYYVVSSPKNRTPGRRRRWAIEGGPHNLHTAQLVYEERSRRLRNDQVDVEIARFETPMERVG